MKQNTSFKIAAGYVILISLLLGAAYYIYKATDSVTRTSEIELLLAQRRKAVHQVISRISEMDNIGQTIGIGYPNAYPTYEQAFNHVMQSITVLDSLSTDSIQKVRLDTLTILLHEKSGNMALLARLIQDNGVEDQYRQKLEKIISRKDTISHEPHIARQVTEETETQTVEIPKKKFIQRLAEVFHPHKKDSVEINTRNIKIMETDTLMQDFNAGDTIARFLHDMQKEMQRSATRRRSRIHTYTEKLQYTGIELNCRIAELLENIEEEEQESVQETIEMERQNRRRAAITTAFIATGAILLAIIFFIIIWRDLTRSNRYRKELEDARKRAEDLLTIRERLMLTVTHDIKAPAGAIVSYADLLAPYIQDGQPATFLKNIRSSSTHLLSLVNSLLDYHRLETGKADLQTIRFNPSELLHELTETFRPTAEKKGLELRCHTAPDTHRFCSGDAIRIRQIAENLIGNALKFTSAGKVEVEAHFQGSDLHLAVSDTGCGMTKEEQQQIFKAFTRLKSALGEEGFGLGLSIALKTTELLGGTLDVESSLGQGSTFRIIIPLDCTGKTPHPQNETPLLPPMSPLSILLVDDDGIQLHLTHSMLEQLRSKTQPENPEWEIVCCRTPEEVFSHIKKQHFDLLFTDIQMPSMDGFKLIHQLHESGHPHLPTIALTARQDMDESQFRQCGFSTCLYKPFDQNELAQAILKAVRPSTTVPPVSKSDSPAVANDTLHFDGLTTFADGDPDSTREILDTFLRETKLNAELFLKATKDQDKKTLCALAHKLIPTFTLIHAPCVHALQLLNGRREEEHWTDMDDAPAEEVLASLQMVIRTLEKSTDGNKNT